MIQPRHPCIWHGHRHGFGQVNFVVLALFSKRTHPEKGCQATKRSPKEVRQDACGGSCSISQHAESAKLWGGVDGFSGLISTETTDFCVLHLQKRNLVLTSEASSTPRNTGASSPSHGCWYPNDSNTR